MCACSAGAAAGPSDLLPSSPTLVLLSSRQITSSLSAFLSLGCDAADARLVASPGEAEQEVRTRTEEKKINVSHTIWK